MESLSFPKMFTQNRTLTVSSHEATKQNLLLLLFSEKGSLFGDPYFGVALRKLIYEQNSSILADLVIDEIYSAITIFMPQLSLKREDITIVQDKVDLILNIKCTNMLDYTTDMFSINLTNTSEDGQ